MSNNEGVSPNNARFEWEVGTELAPGIAEMIGRKKGDSREQAIASIVANIEQSIDFEAGPLLKKAWASSAAQGLDAAHREGHILYRDEAEAAFEGALQKVLGPREEGSRR